MKDMVFKALGADHAWSMTELVCEYLKLKSSLALSKSRVKRLEESLNRIASWKEGDVVNGSFDEPESARIAREALADRGKELKKCEHGLHIFCEKCDDKTP